MKKMSNHIGLSFKAFLMICTVFFLVQSTAQSQTKPAKTKTNVQKSSPTSANPVKSIPITVRTDQVINITNKDATCLFTVTGIKISECGACFSVKVSPTVNDKHVICADWQHNTQVTAVGLKANNIYYVRAYVKTGNQIIYGNQLSFKMQPTKGRTGKPNKDYGNK